MSLVTPSTKAAPPKGAQPIKGTVAVDGCSVKSGDVGLAARELVPTAIDASPQTPHASGAPGAPTGPVLARLTTKVSGSDQKKFKFEVTNALKNHVYQLGVQIKGRTCKLVSQGGPRAGVVMNTTTQAVTLTATATATQLEIYRGQPFLVVGDVTNRDNSRWDGSDAVDSTAANQTRLFHWASALSGVDNGQWQVATTPFGMECAAPKGPLATGPAAFRKGPLSADDSAQFTVDFTEVIRVFKPPPSATGGAASGGAGAASIPTTSSSLTTTSSSSTSTSTTTSTTTGGAVAFPSGAVTATTSGTTRPATATAQPAAPASTAATTVEDTIAAEVRRLVDDQRVLYVRVVARKGRSCVGVSNPAVVRYGPMPKVETPSIDLSGLSGPRLDARIIRYDPHHQAPLPGGVDACFVVSKPHTVESPFDLFGVILTAGELGKRLDVDYPKRLCIKPSDSDSGFLGLGSVLDSIESAISDVGDYVAQGLDYAASIWHDVQDAAVNLVASALSATGIGCDRGSPCRQALETGVKVALASMGMPPSLPTFDELGNVSVDYVARQVAEQTGVPAEITKRTVSGALEGATRFAEEAIATGKRAGSGDGLGVDWLKPDPTFRFHPAAAVVRVTRPANDPYPANAPRPATSLSLESDIYRLGRPVDLPSLRAGESITVPVVLLPNLGIVPDADRLTDARKTESWDQLVLARERFQLVFRVAGASPRSTEATLESWAPRLSHIGASG